MLAAWAGEKLCPIVCRKELNWKSAWKSRHSGVPRMQRCCIQKAARFPWRWADWLLAAHYIWVSVVRATLSSWVLIPFKKQCRSQPSALLRRKVHRAQGCLIMLLMFALWREMLLQWSVTHLFRLPAKAWSISSLCAPSRCSAQETCSWSRSCLFPLFYSQTPNWNLFL